MANSETTKPKISLPLATAAAILNLGSPATLEQIIDFIKEWMPYYKQQNAWYGTKFETNVITYRNIEMKKIGSIQKFSVKNEGQYRREVENFVRRHRVTDFGLSDPEEWNTFFGFSPNIQKRRHAAEEETSPQGTAESANTGPSTSNSNVAASSSSGAQTSLFPQNDSPSSSGTSMLYTPSRSRGRPRLYKFPENRSSGRTRGRPRKNETRNQVTSPPSCDASIQTTPSRDPEDTYDDSEEVILIDDDDGVPDSSHSGQISQSPSKNMEAINKSPPSMQPVNGVLQPPEREPQNSNRRPAEKIPLIQLDKTPPPSSPPMIFSTTAARLQIMKNLEIATNTFNTARGNQVLQPSFSDSNTDAENIPLQDDDIMIIDDDIMIIEHEDRNTAQSQQQQASVATYEEEQAEDDEIMIVYPPKNQEDAQKPASDSLPPPSFNDEACDDEEIIILSSNSPSPAPIAQSKREVETEEPLAIEMKAAHHSFENDSSSQPERMAVPITTERILRPLDAPKMQQKANQISNEEHLEEEIARNDSQPGCSVSETPRLTRSVAQKRSIECVTSSTTTESGEPSKKLRKRAQSSTEDEDNEMEDDEPIVNKRVTRASLRMSTVGAAPTVQEAEDKQSGEQDDDDDGQDDDDAPGPSNDSTASDSEPENDNKEQVTATVHNCRLPIHVYVGLAILNGKRSSAYISIVMKFFKHFKNFQKCCKSFTQDLREVLQNNEFIRITQKKDKGEYFFSINPDKLKAFQKELSIYDNLSASELGLKKKEMWEKAKRGELGICKPKPKKEEIHKKFMTSIDCDSQHQLYQQYLSFSDDVKEMYKERAHTYGTCVFCGLHPCSEICDAYPYYEDRLKRCKDLKICVRCYLPKRPGHREDCVIRWCDFCFDNKHGTAMCTENRRPVKPQ